MTASMTRGATGDVSARNLRYLDEHLQRYIAAGKLPGTLTMVQYRGETVHWSAQGMMDREAARPVSDDTI